MADDIAIKDASDATRVVATDEVGGRGFQLVKICYGADGAVTLVDGAGNPLPVGIVGTVPVTGPLTDAQLRAAAVDVAIAGTPSVTITGTPTVNANVLGVVEIANDAGDPIPVLGPATNAELRASALPVTGAFVFDEDAPHASGDKGIALLGIRHDSDTPTAADGDYTLLKLDETGRLKVASQPSSYAAVTGAITANGQTIATNCERYSNLMVHCFGTFSTVNCAFEGSLNSTNGSDGNWFALQAIRSNANTIETTTGNLSAAPAYAWELSVNGLKWFRVRATAFTSGSQSWVFVPGTYATEPIPGAQVSATQAVSGTVTATNVVGSTPTASNVNSAATTNATSVKATAGTVYSILAYNAGAGAAFVKFYNKASAPTVGTDVPIFVLAVPAAGHVQVQFGIQGNRFGTGIALAITGGAADTDTTAVAAAQVKVSTAYV